MAETNGADTASLGVSVIIPSINRQELARAIQSVLRQEGPLDLDIVVVFDLPAGAAAGPVVDHRVKYLFTGGGRGGGGARNVGVQQATKAWVAFLDDDDEWLPTKLQAQLSVAVNEGTTDLLLATRHTQVVRNKESAPIPVRVYERGPVEDYLFRRRRPGGGRASMFTSTLLTARERALATPWQEDLRRHQDWDWIIRCQREGAVVKQMTAPLTRIHSGTGASISASKDWAQSLHWAEQAFDGSDPQTTVDFLCAQTLRYAVMGRDGRGIRRVLRAVLRQRRVPSAGPIVIAVAGIVPRVWFERLVRAIR